MKKLCLQILYKPVHVRRRFKVFKMCTEKWPLFSTGVEVFLHLTQYSD